MFNGQYVQTFGSQQHIVSYVGLPGHQNSQQLCTKYAKILAPQGLRKMSRTGYTRYDVKPIRYIYIFIYLFKKNSQPL